MLLRYVGTACGDELAQQGAAYVVKLIERVLTYFFVLDYGAYVGAEPALHCLYVFRSEQVAFAISSSP